MNKVSFSRLLRKISAFLLVFFAVSSVLLTAAAGTASETSCDQTFPEPQRAAYLGSPLQYSVSGISQRALFVSRLNSEAVNSDSPLCAEEEISSLLFPSSQENSSWGAFAFLPFAAAAERDNLIFAGTFLPTGDCAEQIAFLLGVNRFYAELLGPELPESSCLSGVNTCASLPLLHPGDLLFSLDKTGVPVGAAVVCEEHRSGTVFAVSVPGQELVLVQCEQKLLPELGSFLLIRPEYAFNETLIWLFCVDQLHFTRSAACGILANVQCESSALPDREETDTDPEAGFGICQWSFERREAFDRFCGERDLDRYLLESQLLFMGYEFETNYSFTGDFLRSAPETDEGAYDSGYWVCFEYEQPKDFEFVSAERAELSLNLWKKLNGK